MNAALPMFPLWVQILFLAAVFSLAIWAGITCADALRDLEYEERDGE